MVNSAVVLKAISQAGCKRFCCAEQNFFRPWVRTLLQLQHFYLDRSITCNA